MPKSRLIIFWHGKQKNLVEYISKFCTHRIAEGYYWNGSIDEFLAHYGGPIIVTDDYIAITHRKHFGAC